MIMAPFTPFLAEELYQKLTEGESVHLLDWPIAGHVNELVVSDMEMVREYVNVGLSIRAKERIKVRQPLESVSVPSLGTFVDFESILIDELNVKKVKVADELSLNLELTASLKREGLMREVIRYIQNARKSAGLNVDDRIRVSLETHDEELLKAIADHKSVIMAEVLAEALTSNEEYVYVDTVKVEGNQMTISLEKA